MSTHFQPPPLEPHTPSHTHLKKDIYKATRHWLFGKGLSWIFLLLSLRLLWRLWPLLSQGAGIFQAFGKQCGYVRLFIPWCIVLALYSHHKLQIIIDDYVDNKRFRKHLSGFFWLLSVVLCALAVLRLVFNRAYV